MDIHAGYVHAGGLALADRLRPYRVDLVAIPCNIQAFGDVACRVYPWTGGFHARIDKDACFHIDFVCIDKRRCRGDAFSDNHHAAGNPAAIGKPGSGDSGAAFKGLHRNAGSHVKATTGEHILDHPAGGVVHLHG